MTRLLTKPPRPGYVARLRRPRPSVNNGVWGGCWCMGFHPAGWGATRPPSRTGPPRSARVLAGTRARGPRLAPTTCVGWSQTGSPEELPRIKSRQGIRGGGRPAPGPRGASRASSLTGATAGRASPPPRLAGALDESPGLGGGTVESSPEDVEGPEVCRLPPPQRHAGAVRGPGLRADQAPRQKPVDSDEARVRQADTSDE